MLIGGFNKVSMIDFPKKISCVIFTFGCNFDCPYCHNPALVKKTDETVFLDENEILDFLDKRVGLLEGVVITGGEPTLQSDLASFCSKIKSKGFPIKLDTNGSRPDELKKLIDLGLIDYIAMDIKTVPENYTPLISNDDEIEKSVKESIKIVMNSGVDYEFRTTCVKPFVDTEAAGNIGRLIEGAKLYAIQNFSTARVLSEEFFESSERGFTEKELSELKSNVVEYVDECVIR